MSGRDLYRDCFWCATVYDFWRHEACPSCGSRLEHDGFLGPLAGEHNKRPDYSGPDYSEYLKKRQAEAHENGLIHRITDEDLIRRYLDH